MLPRRMAEQPQTIPSPNFASELSFELLFHDDCENPTARVAQQLQAPAVDRWFEIEGHTFRVAPTDFPALAAREPSLQQSWNWREAAHVVGHCRRAVLVADHVDDWRGYRERVTRFRRVLAAAIRELNPLAVHCPSSQQFLEPRSLAEALEEEGGEELFGFLNIRFYKFEGHDKGIEAEFDETVMDTLGLGALGLPDLQAHFKHLDPSLVAQLLYSTAQYVFSEGPVIESGHNLQGFAPDQKWICQLEESITDPVRLVVDLNPGKPYAAGNR